MRAVVQRVKWGRVRVDGALVGEIEAGAVVLLGVASGDTPEVARSLADKLIHLRVFSDSNDKMNLSLEQVGGGCLVISQFTLIADCKRGRRPFFGGAEQPDRARTLCDMFVETVAAAGVQTATGEFGASMEVELCNDGPVTIVLDSDELGLG